MRRTPDIRLYPPRGEKPEDPLDPARGICWGIVLTVAITALAWLVLTLSCERADASTFDQHARAAIANPCVAEWKRDLFRQALAHNAQEEECRVSYYHPSESSNPKWRKTYAGTLVRPGVVCVHASRWNALRGAWLWVSGVGLVHVEDRDVYRSRLQTPWLDVAVPEAFANQSYSDWLGDPGRVRLAKAFGVRDGRFVVVKPRGGYD